MAKRIAILILLFSAFSAFPAWAKVVKTDHATAELLSTQRHVKAGDEFYLGIELILQKNWHTYWINPGDAGLATEITWELPKGLVAGDVQWPTPGLLSTGDMMNYGYGRRTVYSIPFTATSAFDDSRPVNVIAHVSWLICGDICVPGQADINFVLNDADFKKYEKTQEMERNRIQAALDALPAPRDDTQVAASFFISGDKIKFHFSGPGLANVSDNPDLAYFFPKDSGAIEHAEQQQVRKAKDGFYILTKAGFRSIRGKLENIDGVFVILKNKTSAAWSVRALPGSDMDVGMGGETLPTPPAPHFIRYWIILGFAVLALALFFFVRRKRAMQD